MMFRYAGILWTLLGACFIANISSRDAPATSNNSDVTLLTDPPSPCIQYGYNNVQSYTNISVHRRYTPAMPLGPADSDFGRKHKLDQTLQLLVFVRPPADLESDGYKRFIRSCKINQIKHEILPESIVLGSRSLVSILHKKLQENLVILWIEDPQDTIMLAESTEILQLFQSLAAPDTNNTKVDRNPVGNQTKTPFSSILMTGMRICKDFCGIDQYQWPAVAEGAKFGTRYVDPTMLMGHIDSFVELVAAMPPPLAEDALGTLAKAYKISPMHHLLTLYGNNDTVVRDLLKFTVDRHSALFQSLYGHSNDLIDGDFHMRFKYRGKNDTRLFNSFTSTFPAVVHGGGNTDLLDQIGNYAPLQWTETTGCTTCVAHKPCAASAADVASGKVSRILVLLHVEWASPFLDYMLEAFESQDYPKEMLELRISITSSPSLHLYNQTCRTWATNLRKPYAKLSIDASGANYSDAMLAAAEYGLNARSEAGDTAFDYVFYLSSNSYLNDSAVLNMLVHENRTAIGPKLTRSGKYFSNFWGTMEGGPYAQCFDDANNCLVFVEKKYCSEGEYKEWMKVNCARSCGHCKVSAKAPNEVGYKRSADYFDIIERKRVGVWAAPLVNSAILINKRGLKSILQGHANDLANNIHNAADVQQLHPWTVSLLVSAWIRRRHDSMYVSNVLGDAGILIDAEAYNHNRLHPELYLLPGNEPLWRRRYLHADYSSKPVKDFVAPHCWDVYQFPLFNFAFCDQLIAESEHYGKWSGSSAYDDRLQGGYEPVPTQDIHFNQFGWDKAWTAILKTYVAPIANGIYTGYSMQAKKTLDFIVRYKQGAQTFLRPHHDASTVSVSVALNIRGVDFQGGGTRYIRQNCTVYNGKGMGLLHPGILTHQHEGGACHVIVVLLM